MPIAAPPSKAGRPPDGRGLIPRRQPHMAAPAAGAEPDRSTSEQGRPADLRTAGAGDGEASAAYGRASGRAEPANDAGKAGLGSGAEPARHAGKRRQGVKPRACGGSLAAPGRREERQRSTLVGHGRSPGSGEVKRAVEAARRIPHRGRYPRCEVTPAGQYPQRNKPACRSRHAGLANVASRPREPPGPPASAVAERCRAPAV
jgi:hypothetical protein